MYSILLELPTPRGHAVFLCNQRYQRWSNNCSCQSATVHIVWVCVSVCVHGRICVIRVGVPLLQIILTQLQLHRSWLDVPCRKGREGIKRTQADKWTEKYWPLIIMRANSVTEWNEFYESWDRKLLAKRDCLQEMLILSVTVSVL